VSRVLYFEAGEARRNRDWFSRMAQSADPVTADYFRARADRLTAELERIEREKAEANV
jgi:hypothetical protein